MKAATVVCILLSVMSLMSCKVIMNQQLKIQYNCKKDSDCPFNEICILDKSLNIKQGLCAQLPEETLDTIALDLHKDVEIAKSRPVIVE